MDTLVAAASIWNCISCRVVFRVEFVWIVDMQRLDVIVTSVKKAITVIQPNRLQVAKYASVSTYAYYFWFVFISILKRSK